jgi:hypothetical protein
MLRIFLFSLSLFLLCSCAVGSQSATALFAYKEFGPPSMSSEMLGMDWWQWQEHGDSQPKQYDIKVVVYRNISLEEAKKKYPVVPEQLKDYRYAEYSTVVGYLDRQIEENVIESLTATLKETREKVVKQLGTK